MKRTRFTEKPIIGVSEATIYNSKAKYGGLEVSEAQAASGRCDAGSGGVDPKDGEANDLLAKRF